MGDTNIHVEDKLMKQGHNRDADLRYAIEEAIYEKRLKLNACVEAYGLADPRCLRKSIELDHLLNQFNRLQKAAKKRNSMK
jgi:hypothetical protein